MKVRPQLVALFVLCLPVHAQFKDLRARDWTSKGMKAFRTGNYPQAADDFKQALELEPKLKNAALYLGTTYAAEVIPDVDTSENLKTADLAITVFDEVLAYDPTNLTSLKQLASIYRVTKRLEKAKEYELRVVALAPDDAEAHYTLGVIDWMMTYRNAVARLATEGLTDDGVGNLSKSTQACTDLLAANQNLNDEGIQKFTKAIALRPNYRDAMIYINLVYRRKADLHCGPSGDEQTDIAAAVDWTKRVELIDKTQPPIVSKRPL